MFNLIKNEDNYLHKFRNLWECCKYATNDNKKNCEPFKLELKFTGNTNAAGAKNEKHQFH